MMISGLLKSLFNFKDESARFSITNEDKERFNIYACHKHGSLVLMPRECEEMDVSCATCKRKMDKLN